MINAKTNVRILVQNIREPATSIYLTLSKAPTSSRRKQRQQGVDRSRAHRPVRNGSLSVECWITVASVIIWSNSVLTSFLGDVGIVENIESMLRGRKKVKKSNYSNPYETSS